MLDWITLDSHAIFVTLLVFDTDFDKISTSKQWYLDSYAISNCSCLRFFLLSEIVWEVRLQWIQNLLRIAGALKYAPLDSELAQERADVLKETFEYKHFYNPAI